MNIFSKRPHITPLLGFSPRTLIRNIKGAPWFLDDYKKLKQELNNDPEFPFGTFYPILTDKLAESGSASGHYFHQDLLVAQKVFRANPAKHVDIGSRIDGFVAHVAAFREVELFDIRPMTSQITNVRFVQADLMRVEPGFSDYTDSISSLHAIEHFGLGRYNDPIDAYGHIKALDNIYRILKKGGRFYFSTPIGPQRIEFNAHRVFSLNYLLHLFESNYELIGFSYVDDAGSLHNTVPLTRESIETNFNCSFGCGIFELVKK